MMTKEISRGAIWRQWDLHVHTPASFHWSGDRFDVDLFCKSKKLVDEMIEAMNNAEPAVFAIMDYWTFDGWLALRRRLKDEDAPALKSSSFQGSNFGLPRQ